LLIETFDCSSIFNQQSASSIIQSTMREQFMCPACIANAALVAGSVMSTGGIAALAAKLVRSMKSRDDNSRKLTEKEK